MRLTKYIFLITLLCNVGSSAQIITYKGVFDRMEGDQAIILIESNSKTLIVPEIFLPNNIQMNEWLTIDLIDCTYRITSIDHVLTEKRKRKSSSLTHKLHEKSNSK